MPPSASDRNSTRPCRAWLSAGLGHYHEELLDRRYRFWNFHSYVVCYIWRKRPIQIIAVVHGARDLSAYLATRTDPE